MSLALLIVLAAVAIVLSGLACALLERNDAAAANGRKRGYPGDGS